MRFTSYTVSHLNDYIHRFGNTTMRKVSNFFPVIIENSTLNKPFAGKEIKELHSRRQKLHQLVIATLNFAQWTLTSARGLVPPTHPPPSCRCLHALRVLADLSLLLDILVVEVADAHQELGGPHADHISVFEAQRRQGLHVHAAAAERKRQGNEKREE
jgi:hypothetical protein